MVAKIENGTNWKVHKPIKSGSTTVCVNEARGVTVFVEDLGSVVKIPTPHNVDPMDATGEGVTVSKLRDEEGLDPQVFLNVNQKGWLTLFEGKENDSLKITNIYEKV